MAKFTDRTTTTKHSKTFSTDYFTTKKTNDTNSTSLFGTIFTVSSSKIAGITESVITPGISFLKFCSEIMTFYKKMVHNYNTIKTKTDRLNSILSSFSENKKTNINHIRNSVIKHRVSSKK